MKVILKKTVPKYGQKNTVVEVSDGYARNFLFPNDYAVPATASNLSKLAKTLQANAAAAAAAEREAQQLADQIKEIELKFQLIGHKDKFSKAISNKQLVDLLLTQYQIKIDKRKFTEHQPITCPGRYVRTIKLTNTVRANLHITVTAEEK